MDEALHLIIELNEWVWSRFKDALNDATPEEIDWRPLPQANNINAILRHLRIEAQWHLDGLERGEPMPAQSSDASRERIDLAPMDFGLNLKALQELYIRFIAILRGTTLPALRRHSALAYRNFPGEALRPAHLLGFQQATHMAMHLGQICSIRNLYRTTRGEPARFFPENPTFPK